MRNEGWYKAKPGHGVEIGDAVVMPGFAELVAQGAADQDNTAFQPPQISAEGR